MSGQSCGQAPLTKRGSERADAAMDDAFSRDASAAKRPGWRVNSTRNGALADDQIVEDPFAFGEQGNDGAFDNLFEVRGFPVGIKRGLVNVLLVE